jgi:hypothetical protein
MYVNCLGQQRTLRTAFIGNPQRAATVSQAHDEKGRATQNHVRHAEPAMLLKMHKRMLVIQLLTHRDLTG